jgi:hypothetical protein
LPKKPPIVLWTLNMTPESCFCETEVRPKQCPRAIFRTIHLPMYASKSCLPQTLQLRCRLWLQT